MSAAVPDKGPRPVLNRLKSVLFRRGADERTVAALYGSIVAQARQPAFHLQAGVPDSVEGRFELVALHAWLVMRRLTRDGQLAEALNQRLFDFMFADLDVNLREIGVSEMRVGKKVKELAEHYYGRATAYEAALRPDAPDGALSAALDRNLYGSVLPDPLQVQAMARYVRAQATFLEALPSAELLAGRLRFDDKALATCLAAEPQQQC
jgi:cytochrome b pre-mRNA-processing protein 3